MTWGAVLLAACLTLQDDEGDEKFTPPTHADRCPVECAPCQDAVKKAVEYLAKSQRADGSWEVKMIAYQMYGNAGEIPTAVTSALCLMASGGDYRTAIRKTQEYVLKKMKDSNLFKTEPPKGGMMRHWHLAYALLFLTEVQARDKQEAVAEAIQQLVKAIEASQEKAGGWKHGLGQSYRDILITTVLCLNSLYSARVLEFQVSDAVLNKGKAYIKACLAKDGKIYYSPDFNSDVRNGDEARAAAVSYFYKRIGLDSEEVYRKAKAYARANPKEIPGHSLHTSALSNLFGGLDGWLHGRDEWTTYWKLIRDDLHEVQRLDGHFRWQRKWDNAYQLDGRIGFAWVTSNYLLFMQIPVSNLLITRGVSTSKAGGQSESKEY